VEFKDRITHMVLDGEEKTMILLGPEEYSVPESMFSGEKLPGYIVSEDGMEKWHWEGMTGKDGLRYVYFPPLEIHPFQEISTTFRKDALKIIRLIASALKSLGDEFTDDEVGIVPTWRFLLLSNSSVLILPPDLSSLISLYMEDEERYGDLGAYAVGGTEENFALIRQMGEFMYYSLTGIAPYKDRRIRDFGYREADISLFKEELFPNLSDETIGFINYTLHAKSTEQRDAMGNRNPSDSLSWFLRNSESLSWDVDCITEERRKEAIAKVEKTEKAISFMRNAESGAKKRNFWRKKGSTILIALVSGLIVLAIAGSYIKNLTAPPETKDLDEVGVIEALYDAQSDLNTSKLTTAVKGFTLPQEMEVIALHVTSATRSAYENIPIKRADEWADAGFPALENINTFIYGVDDVEIEEIGEHQFRATGKIYVPLPYDDEVRMEGNYEYVYSFSQDFTMKRNRRGWWNIVYASPMDLAYEDAIELKFQDIGK